MTCPASHLARPRALPRWLAAAAVLQGCAGSPPTAPSPPQAASPISAPAATPGSPMPPSDAPREFRAAWVATVGNIDWPSRPGLSSEAMRAETRAILDRARAIGLNALLLQVRPAGDAIYPSALEPWSEVLSGEQGRAPGRADEPAWDPLVFWVDEAHRRGLELHAWFNPFRARTASARSPLVLPHLALRRPELARRYGDQRWFDPGAPESAAQLLAVVADVQQRYDIDGVHIDDYFYPYPAAGADGGDLPFPDDDTYAAYRLSGGELARDDWRRANVDKLVQALYRQVRQTRSCARFGISPFGIGRPDRRPPGISGFSQYDRLYADVERWLEQGWLDYLAPQLYWPMNRPGQSFPALLDYWVGQSKAARPIWPGLYTSQTAAPGARSAGAWPAAEVLDQVQTLRERNGNGLVSGHIHFSMVALMQDRDGIAARLQSGPYAQPALPPVVAGLDPAAPLPPPRVQRDGTRVAWQPGAGPPPAGWALWRREGGQWRFESLPGAVRAADAGGADAIALRALDRCGRLGEVLVMPLS